MDTGDEIAFWALMVALAALVVSSVISAWAARSAALSARSAQESVDVARDALANMRTQTSIARLGLESTQSARDWADRPLFRMTPDEYPEGDRWGITVEMVGGPTRVEARWLHQGDVSGPWRDVGNKRVRSTVFVLGERGGPAFLHKGSTFRVAVECPEDPDALHVEVSVTTAELEPGTDEPTGRQWPHIETVQAERPSPPTIW